MGTLRAKAAKATAERKALQAIANAASACRAAAVAEAKVGLKGHEVTSAEIASTMDTARLRRMDSRLAELRQDLAAHMINDFGTTTGNRRVHTPLDGPLSAGRGIGAGGMLSTSQLPGSIEECRALIDFENELLNQSLFDRLTRTREV